MPIQGNLCTPPFFLARLRHVLRGPAPFVPDRPPVRAAATPARLAARAAVDAQLSQKLAFNAIQLVRSSFDKVTGYGNNMTEAKWLQRMLFLVRDAPPCGVIRIRPDAIRLWLVWDGGFMG